MDMTPAQAKVSAECQEKLGEHFEAFVLSGGSCDRRRRDACRRTEDTCCISGGV